MCQPLLQDEHTLLDQDTHLIDESTHAGYDASGFMTWTEYCKLKTSPDDWDCPVICKNETAKKCGDGWDAYCVSLSDTCPEVCTSEQQLCWVADYDASGNWLGGSDVCHDANEDCPCGTNSQLCAMDGYSYCESTFYGCPEYCMPTSWECPVTCTADQKRCYLTDFNASGYPEKYSEKCVAQGEECRCGTHSQKCYDPWFDENYCYPLVDFWSGQKMNCPVYCQDNEDYCYIPSYDARGDWISFTAAELTRSGADVELQGRDL
eukprot:g30223.t1